MQIIAHITDLMKYDLRPNTGGSSSPISTTTTPRPTSSHRPGLYAPDKPLGPETYYHRDGTSYEQYMQILQNSDGQDYFDKYKNPLLEDVFELDDKGIRSESDRSLDIENRLIEELMDKRTAEIFMLANRSEESDDQNFDDLKRAIEFAEKYEDDLKVRDYLRQKKVPPTKAYVGLLSIYDLLNKESKRLGLNKYHVNNNRKKRETIF